MPALGPILDEADDDDSTEDTPKLFLPSELSVEDRRAWCPPDIPDLKFRFRYAQADDSLAELCRLLRLYRNLHDENLKHPSLSQKAVTRTKGLFNSFQARKKCSAKRYSHTCNTMLALDPGQTLSPGWMKWFLPLNQQLQLRKYISSS